MESTVVRSVARSAATDATNAAIAAESERHEAVVEVRPLTPRVGRRCTQAWSSDGELSVAGLGIEGSRHPDR
jgi:hypothetical protein